MKWLAKAVQFPTLMQDMPADKLNYLSGRIMNASWATRKRKQQQRKQQRGDPKPSNAHTRLRKLIVNQLTPVVD